MFSGIVFIRTVSGRKSPIAGMTMWCEAISELGLGRILRIMLKPNIRRVSLHFVAEERCYCFDWEGVACEPGQLQYTLHIITQYLFWESSQISGARSKARRAENFSQARSD